ncbi:hypothetical protein ACFSX9_02100 [Flavobacterium ardleyense]|uniref:Peptidase family M41 n=1 Tax=Flavobacterium ardleyense TaxID=2038737 RepID=A0ABW5Z621_9FLAO
MISEKDKVRAKKICIHEAGHLITSKLFGFKTNGISILINQRIGHSGEATIILPVANITNNNELIGYLEKRIQILYAGVIAEFTDLNKNFDDSSALIDWKNGGGMVDYAKIRELTHVLRNIKYPKTSEENKQQLELDKLDKVNFANSVQIVFENIREIHRIGKLLSDKVLQYDITYNLTEGELL